MPRVPLSAHVIMRKEHESKFHATECSSSRLAIDARICRRIEAFPLHSWL
jgi:hypothetical protein